MGVLIELLRAEVTVPDRGTIASLLRLSLTPLTMLCEIVRLGDRIGSVKDCSIELGATTLSVREMTLSREYPEYRGTGE